MISRIKTRTWILFACIVVGMLMMVYPFVSNWLYENSQEEVIYQYQEQMDTMQSSMKEDALKSAQQYNEQLRMSDAAITDPFDPSFQVSSYLDYKEQLNVLGDGIMAYIEIPAISVFLPVYHGTSSKVLDAGVGHLENTSLPVGGESTHAVLSAHSGLTDKKLFSDLELLEYEDQFYIYVLDEILAYEVDSIEVVDPNDTDLLRIQEGKDYVTLVTCTPYGVNSHRLLVRGRRIPYTEKEKQAQGQSTLQSIWMRQYMYAILTSVLLLAGVFLVLILKEKRSAK